MKKKNEKRIGLNGLPVHDCGTTSCYKNMLFNGLFYCLRCSEPFGAYKAKWKKGKQKWVTI